MRKSAKIFYEDFLTQEKFLFLSKGEGEKMQKQIPTEKNLPAAKFRAGAICATIWANKAKSKTGNDVTFQTISLERSYKDKDGNWQHTPKLRANDLPKAMLVLQEAYKNISLSQKPSSVNEEEFVY